MRGPTGTRGMTRCTREDPPRSGGTATRSRIFGLAEAPSLACTRSVRVWIRAGRLDAGRLGCFRRCGRAGALGGIPEQQLRSVKRCAADQVDGPSDHESRVDANLAGVIHELVLRMPHLVGHIRGQQYESAHPSHWEPKKHPECTAHRVRKISVACLVHPTKGAERRPAWGRSSEYESKQDDGCACPRPSLATCESCTRFVHFVHPQEKVAFVYHGRLVCETRIRSNGVVSWRPQFLPLSLRVPEHQHGAAAGTIQLRGLPPEK